MSQYFLGEWVGPATLVVVVILTVWVLTRPAARVIAGDLRTWVVCYLGYLAVVLDPSTSVPRYLLLLFPIGTVLPRPRPPRPTGVPCWWPSSPARSCGSPGCGGSPRRPTGRRDRRGHLLDGVP